MTQENRYSLFVIDSTQSSTEQAIRSAGMRVTRQRIAVFDAVDAGPHASAAAVMTSVSSVLPGISHQAVYDCLAHLTEAGLLRRITFDGGAALYETRTHDNHHHVVCRVCGFVADVDCAVGDAPCLDACDAAGFIIDEAEVTYRGLCLPCATERATCVAPVFQFTPDQSTPEEMPHG
jgi:Fe2+ or Zn2+ uptake regulation protein